MATNKSLYNYYKILLLKINSIKGDKIIMKKTILDQFKNIRTLNEYYRQETKKINDNVNLSQVGKDNKIAELKQSYNEQLFKFKNEVNNILGQSLEKLNAPSASVASSDIAYQVKLNNALLMFKDNLLTEEMAMNYIEAFKDDKVALNAFSAYTSKRNDELSMKLSNVIFSIDDKTGTIQKIENLINSIEKLDADYLFNLDAENNIVDSDLCLSGYEDTINTFSDDMQAVID